MVCPHDSAVIVGRVVGLSSVARPIAQCSEEMAIAASNVLLMFCMIGELVVCQGNFAWWLAEGQRGRGERTWYLPLLCSPAPLLLCRPPPSNFGLANY
ncbi:MULTISPECIES: hypothetical protein [Nostoc]|uniref:Uncharacterized protein n=2 Tax=Nostoc TaxID=1177 RepID=A0ABR8IIG9_9NOSO|nr:MULTISPECIES: hypothetical protein [Nostoc]MBD2564760.1 hypothetical protein [Nostoc linckia FACHB-391]MBD2650642.1 hypothetical protein [Nostoc foliaceum FACHB-393]